MSRKARLWLLAVGGLGVAVLFACAVFDLPRFGGHWHPYGDRAVRSALARHTANVVSSVNFDQRAFDTLGEESILFGAVLGTVVLLRETRDEHSEPPDTVRVDPPVRRYALIALPVTLLVGFYVIAHGQLSPGGGFQGGVVLATGLHLAYVAADYRVLRRVRPLAALGAVDAAAAGAFAALGLAGLITGAAYLQNVLPLGTFNQLTSGGLVTLINAAVGVEVASGVVVLLAQFLDQAVEIESPPEGDHGPGTRPSPEAS